MDFYHDTNKDELCNILHKLQQNGINPPKYVMTKTAHEKSEDLPRTSYAYPEEQQFPIHTKADTWLSAAYFSQKQADLPKTAKDRIKSMIHKGADLWNIPEDQLKKIDHVLAPTLEKQGEDDGSTKVHNQDEFQAYCKTALDSFHKMDLSQRKHISEKLLKTAEEQEWSLDQETRKHLEQSACQGYGLREKVTNYLYNVQTRLPKKASELHHIIDTCLREVDNQPAFPSPEILYKTAALTDIVLQNKSASRQNGQLPEREIFNISRTEANRARNAMVTLPGNRVMWKHALDNSKDALAADLYAMTGKELDNTDEIIQEMWKLTPVVSDRLLSNVEQ